MDEERRMKARGTRNLSDARARGTKTDLGLVGRGFKRNSGGTTENVENTKMPDSVRQTEPTEVEKNKNVYEVFSNHVEGDMSSKHKIAVVHEDQIETVSQRLRINAIHGMNEGALQNDEVAVQKDLGDSKIELATGTGGESEVIQEDEIETQLRKNEAVMLQEGTRESKIELGVSNEGMSTVKNNEMAHQDQTETYGRLQRSASFMYNQKVNNEKDSLRQETQNPETESASGVEVLPLIKEGSLGSEEEIAEHHTSRNARVRSSANTLDAISEIRSDESGQGANLETTSGVGGRAIDSLQVIKANVRSEQRTDRMSLQEVKSSDSLHSSSSKSVVGNDRSNATLDGIKLTDTPQKVVQKANEICVLEEKCLEMMEARRASGSEEEVGDELPDEPKTREVKVVLEGDVNKTFFLNSRLTVREAKEVLVKKLRVISKNIVLRGNGRILSGSELMENVGEVSLELTIDESEENPCDVKGDLDRPKLVQVKILQEDGTWKYSKVAVMKFGSRKQYLGGYRDKRTGQVYYHVICQTETKKRNVGEGKLVTRDIQVNLPTVDCAVNTSRISATQTPAKGLYALSAQGKVIEARPYVPYNELTKTMVPHRAALIIQKAWRQFIFRRCLLKHFEKLAASLKEKADNESTTVKMLQKRREQMMTAAVFPSFRSHFSDLLTFVNNWAKTEAGRLAGTKVGFARKAAMSELLGLEQEMLLAVETQRLRALEENLRKRDVVFLEGTARSRARVYDKGNVTLVDDLNIQKAGVFKEIFASYSRTDTIPAERLEILNCVRGTLLQEFGLNNPTVNDLVEILDREIDLITIGFPKAQMVYLHKRFETKFLHLARDPKVNPQAKYFRKGHVTEKKYAIRRCKLCNVNLPSSLMFSHVRMTQFRICISCVQLEQNVATNLLNLAPYKRILLTMRARELEKNCRSAIPFLVEPLGTYFLVNVIWNGKSILSGNSDLSQLRMTRWLPDKDWSVWNMVLLTEKEVSEHDRIPYPMKHYPVELIQQVRIRNILGRMNFMHLADIDNDFKFDRVSVGTLPRDHVLYTNEHHARFIPDDSVPEFFKPTT